MNIDYENYEVILVDNNSTDESIEFVKNTYPSVIIIKLDNNYGFAEPNNIGAKNAKGDFLLFLNNDTKVKPNFISEMIKSAEKDSKIAICQSILLKPNGDVESSGDFTVVFRQDNDCEFVDHWDVYVNGSVLTTIVGNCGLGEVTSPPLNLQGYGNKVFTIRAITLDGVESAMSNAKVVDVPLGVPVLVSVEFGS